MSPGPICSAYWQSPTVFRGKVLSQTLTTGDTTEFNYYRVRFAVLEMFRGETQTREITIQTPEQSSACGFSFEDGREYLVFTYAGSPGSEPSVNKCSRTHVLDPGVDDPDVSFMRALATAPSGASIFGSLFARTDHPDVIGSGTIRLRGPENHDVAADDKGQYEFAGLAPGKYTVSVAFPPGIAPAEPRTVSLVDKGCAQVDWPILYDGHIRGRIADASGNPLPDIFMMVLRPDNNFTDGLAQISSKVNDSDGRYDFGPLPPGDYLISANSLGPSSEVPYPRFYYPGTEAVADAVPVHLPAAKTVDSIDLTFPNPWRQVIIHARVLLPDGSPVAAADVSAYDSKYLSSGQPPSAPSDSNGRATVSVYEGRTYYLTATISVGDQQRCAGPLMFVAKDGLAPDPIVIKHNWGNCLAQLNPDFNPPR